MMGGANKWSGGAWCGVNDGGWVERISGVVELVKLGVSVMGLFVCLFVGV